MKGTVLGISILMILGGISYAGFHFGLGQAAAKKSAEVIEEAVKERASSGSAGGSGGNAVASSSVTITRLPFDASNVGAIQPLGGLGSGGRSNPELGHPYGNERHFIKHKSTQTPYNVYAPATTKITAFRKSDLTSQWRFNMEIDSDTFVFVDHLTSAAASIESAIAAQFGGSVPATSGTNMLSPPISIIAGDLLGQTGPGTGPGGAWDYGAVDPGYAAGITTPANYFSETYQYARSPYDFATDAAKAQMESLFGDWDLQTSSFTPRLGAPPQGTYGNDSAGTLQGNWFYDIAFSTTWGPNLAVFSPYYLNVSKLQIRLAIPDLDIYGVFYDLAMNNAGNINPNPKNVNSSSGIVYYHLPNSYGGSENGLLMVRYNSNGTLTIETHNGSTDTAAFPNFGAGALTLTR